MVSAVVLPVWNIPLIYRIVQRKSSDDISLAWLFGVWGCILLMAPSAYFSDEWLLRAFAVSNLVFFTSVVVTVLVYRKKK